MENFYNYENDNEIQSLRDATTSILLRIHHVMDQHNLHFPLVRQYGQRDDFTRDEWVNYYRLTNAAYTEALNHMLLQVQQA